MIGFPDDARVGENLEFTRNLREIYEKKTSEVDVGVVKDKGGGEQFLNMIGQQSKQHWYRWDRDESVTAYKVFRHDSFAHVEIHSRQIHQSLE